MKLLLQSIGLLAATAIPLSALPTVCLRCGDLEKRLRNMAYLANDFRNDNCTTDHCLAFYKEAQDLAVQIDELGCHKAEVNAAAQMERRKEPPDSHGKCDIFHSQLVTLNQMLATNLTAPSDEDDRSDTYRCVGVHESLPEIDIWSNRCASSVPEIGKETVNLATSLQRAGCVWNSTCGPSCFQIGNDMFDAVTKMGPMQCNRFDSPDEPPKGDSERSMLRPRHGDEEESECAQVLGELASHEALAHRCDNGCTDLQCADSCPQVPATRDVLLRRVYSRCPYSLDNQDCHQSSTGSPMDQTKTCSVLQLDLQTLHREHDRITNQYSDLARDVMLKPLMSKLQTLLERMECQQNFGPPLGLPQALQARNDNGPDCATLASNILEAKDQVAECKSLSHILKQHSECTELRGKLHDLYDQVKARNCSLDFPNHSRKSLQLHNENATACAFLVEEVTEARDQAIDCKYSDPYFLKHHHECKDLPRKLKDLDEEVKAMNCSLNGTPRPRSLSPNGSLEASATMSASPQPDLHKESCNVVLSERAAVDHLTTYYTSKHFDVPYYIGDWRDFLYGLTHTIPCEHSTNAISPVASRSDHAVACDDITSAMTDLDHLTLFYLHNVDVVPDWLWDWQRFLYSLAKSASCNAPEVERAERLVKRLDHSEVEESCENARKAGNKVDLAMEDYTRKGRAAPRWTLSWLTSLNHIKANLGCDD